MRWIVVLVALTTSVAYAGRASNPAFLGIGMDRVPNGGCRVESVTAMSPAEAAGLHSGDVIHALDGVNVSTCEDLTAEIVAHGSGDVVKLDVSRLGERITAHATLSTRAEILHRRLVGRPLDSTDAIDVDDKTEFDLADLKGEPTVLVWFDHRCGDCVSLIRRLSGVVQAPRKNGNAPRLIAVTYGSASDLANVRTTTALGVPLAVVDQRAFESSATNDGDRVFAMVLDRRGHVCFVTPIAPQDDSLDAAIDEVLAAAEQAEHARARR